MNQPAIEDELTPAVSEAPAPVPALVEPDEDAPAFASSETYLENREAITRSLAKYNSNYALFGEAHQLGDRFEIDVSQEVQYLSKPHAKAYRVLDKKKPDRACVGYVTEPYRPYRHDALELLSGHQHPNLMNLLDAGKVYMPAERANRFVMVFRQPTGVPLSMMIANQEYFLQSEVVKKLVAPIASLLHMLHNLELHHGNIHAGNIYIDGDKVTVGECLLESSVTTQPLLYQPIEQLASMPDAQGTGDITTDIYALAILMLDAIGELESKRNMTRPQLIALLLSRGSYISYVNESSVSDQLVDLLRGSLVESLYDRWMPDALVDYVKGKRFNIIPPSPPRESPRAHHFEGADFYTRRSMANALYARWEKATAHINEGKIPKWLDSMSYKDGSGDKVTKTIKKSGRPVGSATGAHHELIARIIMVLDPQGPLRYREFHGQANALPSLLCHIMETGDLQLRSVFNDIINHDLAAFWSDNQPLKSHTILPKLSWDIGLARQMMYHKTLGFGMERVLYEINPALPCMSRHVLPYHVTSAKELLLALDALAKEHAENNNFVDKHLIAFLAAKAGIRKEIKIKEHKLYPDLYNDSEVQALVILARAQDKAGIAKLPGLTHWVALRVAELLEHIHSTEIRRSFSRDVKTALPEGKISLILSILQNKDYIIRDCKGHLKAQQLYDKNKGSIKKLVNEDKLRKQAYNNGLRVAFILSQLLLFAVLYYVLKKYTL